MLQLNNLNQNIREIMLQEVELDERKNRVYFSARLCENKKSDYIELLKEMVKNSDEVRFANRLKMGFLKQFDNRGHCVPVNASETLAISEFLRYYMRAICIVAINVGNEFVQVYRAKDSFIKRIESVLKEGRCISAVKLLEELRDTYNFNGCYQILNPNSGLCVQLLTSDIVA